MKTTATATIRVAATAAQVWALLCDPARHREFDDTGMVGGPIQPELLARVHQVFSMQMTYRGGGAEAEVYVSDNHVTVFKPLRSLAWMTATQGGPPLGWVWRYDLTAADDDAVLVSLTYDWTTTPAENVQKFGVPLVDAAGIDRSLHRLAQLVGTWAPSEIGTTVTTNHD